MICIGARSICISLVDRRRGRWSCLSENGISASLKAAFPLCLLASLFTHLYPSQVSAKPCGEESLRGREKSQEQEGLGAKGLFPASSAQRDPPSPWNCGLSAVPCISTPGRGTQGPFSGRTFLVEKPGNLHQNISVGFGLNIYICKHHVEER